MQTNSVPTTQAIQYPGSAWLLSMLHACLVTLEVFVACMQTSEAVAIVKLFPALEQLECPLPSRAVDALCGLENLTTLRLEHTHTAPVTDTLLCLQHLQHLQHLVITGCVGYTSKHHNLVCQWPALKTLHLRCTVFETGLLSALNPMSSPCLQQVKGALNAEFVGGSGIVQREVQQMQALQARLG